jgi:hypothetical protein
LSPRNPGVDPAGAAEKADYPAESWAERIRDDVDLFYDEATKLGFTSSFAALDLLFFGLAIVTAYRIAGRRASQTDESPESR